MSKISIRFFNDREVRAIWDEDSTKWWFSAVDIVAAITDSPNPRKYWSVLKTRLKKEGNKKVAEISLSDQILLFIVQREAIVDITGTLQVQR